MLFDFGRKIGIAWERDGKRHARKFRNPLGFLWAARWWLKQRMR